MKSTCLVLSAGGARGFAHIGVIKALIENDIPINKIIGSSMGALIGSGFALNPNIEFVTEVVKEFSKNKKNYYDPKSKFLKLNLKKITEFLNFYGANVEQSNLRIPLEIAVANFNTGELKSFTSGNLTRNLIAAISIPMLTEPSLIDNELYADTAFVSSLPLELYNPADGILIASDSGGNKVKNPYISSNKPKRISKLLKKHHVLHVIRSGINIGLKYEKMRNTLYLDKGVILKSNLENYMSNEFKSYNEIIDIGYKTTLDSVSEIKTWLK